MNPRYSFRLFFLLQVKSRQRVSHAAHCMQGLTKTDHSEMHCKDPKVPDDPNGLDTEIKEPSVDVGRSDSANLDSVLEYYIRGGFTPEEALMILVPEAFEHQPRLKDSQEVKAFYSYYESIQEAWDGPALLVWADRDRVGATLDRNGLRPAR